MAQEVFLPPPGTTSPIRWPLLPRHLAGWATLGGLVAVGLYPLYWEGLDEVLPTSFLLGLTAFVAVFMTVAVCAGVVFRERDPSVLAALLFGAVAIEVVVGLLEGLARIS